MRVMERLFADSKKNRGRTRQLGWRVRQPPTPQARVVSVARPANPNWAQPELREGGVLEGLGSAQAHHGLGLDLDGLAGLRVAAHARLAVGFHRTADIGDDEFSRSALALSYRQLEELLKKHRCGLLRGAALFSNVRYDLRLAHRL